MPPKKRYQWDTKDSEFEDDRPSRSQKKRDSTALQRMGEELTTLGSSVLAKMPLTPNIREAVLEWQRLSSHEGRRRQMQYIGRLMAEDATEIRDLTAKARNEREHSRPPHAYRALFRKLKSLPAEQ